MPQECKSSYKAIRLMSVSANRIAKFLKSDLRHSIQPQSHSSWSKDASYSRLARGRASSRASLGAAQSRSTRRSYTYNGNALTCTDRNGDEGAVINLFHRNASGRLIRSEHHGWYLYNGRTDVVQRVDDEGNVLRNYRYTAFGAELNPDENNRNPFRFSGEYFDWVTQTYYLRARHFSPRTGRFTQPDPHWTIHNFQNCQWSIMQAGNLYMFAVHNPVMWIDPSGLAIILAAGATKVQIAEFERALAFLKQSETFRELFQLLYDAEEIITIAFVDNHIMGYNPNTRTIYWDPTSGLIMRDRTSVQSAALGLAHEMGHAAQHLKGLLDTFIADPSPLNEFNMEQENLELFEIPIAMQLREPTRTWYSDQRGTIRMNNSIHFRTSANRPFSIFIGRRVVEHNQWPLTGEFFIGTSR